MKSQQTTDFTQILHLYKCLKGGTIHLTNNLYPQTLCIITSCLELWVCKKVTGMCSPEKQLPLTTNTIVFLALVRLFTSCPITRRYHSINMASRASALNLQFSSKLWISACNWVQLFKTKTGLWVIKQGF